MSKRIAREVKTISCMIHIYCIAHHSKDESDICSDCSDLLRYAKKRLLHCPQKENKPTCANCSIHCYNRNMQAKVKEIMRFSGPRMMLHHPILAFFHIIDGLKRK